MSRYCPFKDRNWSCSNLCEWFNDKDQKCSVLVLVDRSNNFLDIMTSYISNEIKIKKSKIEREIKDGKKVPTERPEDNL